MCLEHSNDSGYFKMGFPKTLPNLYIHSKLDWPRVLVLVTLYLFVISTILVDIVTAKEGKLRHVSDDTLSTISNKYTYINNLNGLLDSLISTIADLSKWKLAEAKCILSLLNNNLHHFNQIECSSILQISTKYSLMWFLVFFLIALFPITSWIVYRASHQYEVGQILHFSLRESGILLNTMWIVQSLFLLYMTDKVTTGIILIPFCICIGLIGILGIIAQQRRNVFMLQIHILLLIGIKLLSLISLASLLIFLAAKNVEYFNKIYSSNFWLHPIYLYLFLYFLPYTLVDYFSYTLDLIISLNTLSVLRIGGSADEYISARNLLKIKNARWTTRRFIRSTITGCTPHSQIYKIPKNYPNITSPDRYYNSQYTSLNQTIPTHLKFGSNDSKYKGYTNIPSYLHGSKSEFVL
ncbi:uncharacterized protein CMU_023570 [Cryptosporidium muris RN66]|uniref:Uncharacterized protein n=1 Tax=Cryptosporidium muris (strain RN66) TaxID=441375 RepID=B6ABZ9_CRYMR|nr:uncharacterized protein CMU_023570 [Cryptosporidium muris RN66]EEA05352.1 hypothetical protein CMU_023570 [Cryptosporidium muris RN66]|eukprot:XP_002139701.1 hypothetical protein [Cryptosporidium muris RN66]